MTFVTRIFEAILAVLRNIAAFIRALFVQTTTTDLNVSTQGDLGPLGAFILSLTCDEAKRNLWNTNRQAAIDQSGLPQGDKDLLSAANPNYAAIVTQIVAESGGTGQRHWICIWIR